jgi:nucleoside-diphosphate-sugar epimerase
MEGMSQTLFWQCRESIGKNISGRNAMQTGVLLEDLELITSDAILPWGALRGATVLVTGGTGTIGSAIVRALSAASQARGLGVRVVALGRNTERGAALAVMKGVEFIRYDIREPLKLAGDIDYIFHCAALAKSPDMAANPVGVAETSLQGASNTLALAVEKTVKGMVFLSSMEVYGATDPALDFVTEKDLGHIDLATARGCYPEAKRMCECLCTCYNAQFGLPVVSARLAQTFGAGSSRHDTIVAIQFARNALAGEDIVLHTEGGSRGNFCYITDAIRGLFLILFRGEGGQAYNIANPAASVTIREMAEIVSRDVCGGRVKVRIQKPPDFERRGYAPDVTRRLSAEKLERLGWAPRFGLADMYRRTIQHWRETGETA